MLSRSAAQFASPVCACCSSNSVDCLCRVALAHTGAYLGAATACLVHLHGTQQTVMCGTHKTPDTMPVVFTTG